MRENETDQPIGPPKLASLQLITRTVNQAMLMEMPNADPAKRRSPESGVRRKIARAIPDDSP